MPVRRDSATPTTEGSSSSEDEQDFLESLTRKQVLEISEAFEKGARGGETDAGYSSKSTHPSNKRRRLDKGNGKTTSAAEPEQAPGGFLVDDDDGGGFVKSTPPAAAGGFLLDGDDDEEEQQDSAGGGGGFLPASPSASRIQKGGSSSKSTIAQGQAKSLLLDRIPSVLESLGLDGDDGSILSIFENAAFEDQSQGGLQAVKRKDFLKVAAILITQRDNDREQERAYIRNEKKKTEGSDRKGKGKIGTFVASGGGKGRAVNIDADEVYGGDEHDDSDPLILSTSDEDEEDDDPFNRDNEDSDPWADEDEIDGAFTGGRGSSPPSKRRTTRSRAKDTSPLSDLPPSEYDEEPDTKGKKGSKSKGKGRQQGDGSGKYQLSSRQKEECNKMFQQFFPSNDKNRNQAISMAEIRYVATLLNEKLSDEDVRVSTFRH